MYVDEQVSLTGISVANPHESALASEEGHEIKTQLEAGCMLMSRFPSMVQFVDSNGFISQNYMQIVKN